MSTGSPRRNQQPELIKGGEYPNFTVHLRRGATQNRGTSRKIPQIPGTRSNDHSEAPRRQRSKRDLRWRYTLVTLSHTVAYGLPARISLNRRASYSARRQRARPPLIRALEQSVETFQRAPFRAASRLFPAQELLRPPRGDSALTLAVRRFPPARRRRAPPRRRSPK